VGQRPLLCPLHGARCDATPARTCITMSRYEAQYGTGGLIPASTLTLIIPESSSDLYEDLLSLPPSVPSGLTPMSTPRHVRPQVDGWVPFVGALEMVTGELVMGAPGGPKLV